MKDNEYVSKKKLFEMMCFYNVYPQDISQLEFVDKLPNADMQEVKHARFESILVKKEDWRGHMQSWYYPHACSNCKIALQGTENYCPNCGAKMDREGII